MGCWNDTCMITNLPIRDQAPVVGVMVIIEDFENWYGHRGALPAALPMYGTYNDYGSLDYTGPDCIKEHVLRTIKCKEDMNFEEIIEAASGAESTDKRKTFGGWQNKPVGMALIHKFAWDLYAQQSELVYDAREYDMHKRRDSVRDGVIEGIDGMVKMAAEAAEAYRELKTTKDPEREKELMRKTMWTLSERGAPWFARHDCAGGFGFVHDLAKTITLKPEGSDDPSVLKKAWVDLTMVGINLEYARKMWLFHREGRGHQHRLLDMHAREAEAKLEFIKNTHNCYVDGSEFDQ